MSERSLGFLRALYEDHGHLAYSGEEVSQQDHALQCASLAEAAGEPETIVAAAFLHDLGHILEAGSEENERHQEVAAAFLSELFPTEVAEAIRLHVAAKRYLCFKEVGYWEALSPTSQRTLEHQGGRFSADEAERFERTPFFDEAVRVRRYDDLGKVVGKKTPALDYYFGLLGRIAL